MIETNFIAPVIRRAAEKPDHPTLTFIAEDGAETVVTAAQFHRRATGTAAALRAVGIAPDDLVILVLKHSQQLLSAFWGALYLGAIPSIFPFLTEKLDPALYMERVKTLVTHSGARAVVTYAEFRDTLADLLKDADCRVLTTEEMPEAADANFAAPEVTAEKIAFLQHSSGTTGLQKGVALSHRAVLNQISAYGNAIELNQHDVVASWLPLYHDMGLIAGFVMPIVAGTPLVLMSPFHWVRDPKILLWAIHRHKATLAWLPNFAYNHIARTARPAGLEGLDLSSWRMVINCSEPAYHASHSAFLEKLTPYGLRPEALAVSYAMAENTFAVTQTVPGAPPRLDWVNIAVLQSERKAVAAEAGSAGTTVMVSCGAPIEGTEVRVLDATGAPLGERQVGELAVRSNCMLSGYYKRPDLDAETLVEGWYRTGDMGYLADGEVFITGRMKDLIIVGGKNVYPQDLEAIANHTPGIVPGRAAAFGLMDERIGSEVVVMVAERMNGAEARDPAEIERDLRQRIVQETEVTLADMRLVDERWLIKTSSGKVARGDNRAKYLREFRGQ
ncbi:MAG: fatty acyl-AMP ligase [Anaerolineae bacterium]|nr:MAG: fatty acyl-AMP ligase [Anaerolineae bacterium]